MKKIILTFFVLSLALVSCQDIQEAKVRDVAQQYLDAVGNFRFEEGRVFVTDSSQFIIDKMIGFVNLIPEEELKKNLPVEVVIKQITIDQDTALVTFDTHGPSYTHPGSVYLVKRERKWLVDLLKTFPEQVKRN